jgi:hypothetical protein
VPHGQQAARLYIGQVMYPAISLNRETRPVVSVKAVFQQLSDDSRKDATTEMRFEWLGFDDCFNDFHIDLTNAFAPTTGSLVQWGIFRQQLVSGWLTNRTQSPGNLACSSCRNSPVIYSGRLRRQHAT